VADGYTEAENLLKLELDGGLDLVDLGDKVIVVGDGSRELAGCLRAHQKAEQNVSFTIL
jgi:hypothetical protein